jgi:hypothetical protein
LSGGLHGAARENQAEENQTGPQDHTLLLMCEKPLQQSRCGIRCKTAYQMRALPDILPGLRMMYLGRMKLVSVKMWAL